MKNSLPSPPPILCAHENIADLGVTSPAHPERANFSLFHSNCVQLLPFMWPTVTGDGTQTIRAGHVKGN